MGKMSGKWGIFDSAGELIGTIAKIPEGLGCVGWILLIILFLPLLIFALSFYIVFSPLFIIQKRPVQGSIFLCFSGLWVGIVVFATITSMPQEGPLFGAFTLLTIWMLIQTGIVWSELSEEN